MPRGSLLAASYAIVLIGQVVSTPLTGDLLPISSASFRLRFVLIQSIRVLQLARRWGELIGGD